MWAEVSDEQWDDWRWQMRNRISTLEMLRELVELTPEVIARVAATWSELGLG